ncbi:hypothetical protein [Streptomyces phaeofaciens]|nr:hypothetical protein [Streptomyces phaeofaciens]
MAERAGGRRIGAVVVSLAVLGTAVGGPVWAQSQSAAGHQAAIRAKVSTAPVTDSLRSQLPQRARTTRVLSTTATHGLQLAHPGTVFPAGVSQPSPPSDYIPVTGTVKGRVGDTVVVRLGVKNLGSESPDGGAPGTFAVVPPPGTTITSIPWEGDDDDRRYSCRPPQDKDNHFFLCDANPLPGSSVTIGFHIRIDKRIPGAKGSITVYGPNWP